MKRFGFVIALLPMLLLGGCGGGGEVSGTITGLTADGLSLSNGYETITVAKDASTFVFPTDVDDGKTYSVVVVSQPNELRCSVSNGTGTASATVVVPPVLVSCIPVWSVSGTVSGLFSSGLVLNNGVDDITVAAGAPSFAFPTQLTTGSTYRVTVKTQPSQQSCRVSNGDGQVDSAAVADVAVACD